MNCQRCLYNIAKFNHLKDYYAVLKISKTSDQAAIKKAYYALAKECHPDLNHGREDKFKEINEAYEVLSDENTKRDYDNMKSGTTSRAQSEQYYSDPRRNYANQQQQQYRPNQTYNQNWNTRTAYEQAFRQAQQNFYYQQQSQTQRSKTPNFEEERRKQEEALNRFTQEALLRKQREFQARQQYYEQEKKKQYSHVEREREAYEQYLRQKEYEQYQKERFEEYRYKAEDIEKSLENMQRNWNQIKQNVGSIWNAFKGKKD